MTLAERIEAFSILGDKIKDIPKDSLTEIARRSALDNQWFTEENVAHAFEGLAFMLEKTRLQKWLAPYGPLSPEVPKIIGIVMAGNIPMVGFHDLMSVLLSGHFAAVKASSQDSYLITRLTEWLTEIEPRFKKDIEIRERLTSIDALIATGSDNTARYFEYYFRNHPRVIRKNRTSVAILDGHETDEELVALGKDVFLYFGLGCRNVSKLFVPSGYDPRPFFEANEYLSPIGHHNKYRNNYDYHKSILLVNGVKHLDNGFLLWQPSPELVSPISVLYVEEYQDQKEVTEKLAQVSNKLQCIIGKGHIPFGKGQSPEPWDYADNVDTIQFLAEL